VEFESRIHVSPTDSTPFAAVVRKLVGEDTTALLIDPRSLIGTPPVRSADSVFAENKELLLTRER
jgi:hypothetical protein